MASLEGQLSAHNLWTRTFPFGRVSPLHAPSSLSLKSQFPDPMGLGCTLHEVRNTGEECVWQSPGQLSNVYSVGGGDAYSCWQKSTSRRNIPALSGMGGWLWNVKGERHPTRFWVQLEDPSDENPKALVPRATWGQSGPPHCPRVPTPSSLLMKEQSWVWDPGWCCSLIHPTFCLSAEPRASLTLLSF